MSQSKILPPTPIRHLARITFVAFLFTFIASRTLVILIMARRVPDLFLHLGGTHVHHLNYGIFLLSAVALAFLPRLQRIRLHHYIVGGLLLASVALFYLLLFKALSTRTTNSCRTRWI